MAIILAKKKIADIEDNVKTYYGSQVDKSV